VGRGAPELFSDQLFEYLRRVGRFPVCVAGRQLPRRSFALETCITSLS